MSIFAGSVVYLYVSMGVIVGESKVYGMPNRSLRSVSEIFGCESVCQCSYECQQCLDHDHLFYSSQEWVLHCYTNPSQWLQHYTSERGWRRPMQLGVREWV